MKFYLLFIFVVIIPVITQEDMLQRQQSFQYCKYDDDCRENSFCYGNTLIDLGRCRCKENFIMVERNRTSYQCLPVLDGIGSNCQQDIQCQIKSGSSAVCNNDLCQCKEGTHSAIDNMCYKSAAIGDLCVSHYNCRLTDGSYSFCVDGKCSCNINQHPSEDRMNCYQSVPLGKTCSATQSCFHTFAECFDGICRCIAGYIESDNNTLCWKAASQIGDSCVEDIQCREYIKGSFCDIGVCDCKNGYHGYGNECVKDARPEEACASDKECILTADLQHSVTCSDGFCICVEGINDQNSYGCVIVNGTDQITQPLSILIGLILVVQNLSLSLRLDC